MASSASHGADQTHEHNAECRHNSGSSDDLLAEKINDYIDNVDTTENFPELKGSSLNLEDVIAGNRIWVDKMNREDPEFFKILGGKQDPKYLYIGCSDARVDPSRLMGLDYGKLFVHRNVGNVVSSNDLNLLTVVEFAINHLKVPHIVVCGHYDCGAVRGSIARPTDGGLGLVENWLRNIRDVARLHKDDLFSIEDSEDRRRRLVELNVQEQCLNLFKLGAVQRSRVKTWTASDRRLALPKIHGLVFDPANGVLKKLDLDFKKETDEYGQVYDLYQVPEWMRQRSPTAQQQQERAKRDAAVAASEDSDAAAEEAKGEAKSALPFAA